jgi:hypothetical protein
MRIMLVKRYTKKFALLLLCALLWAPISVFATDTLYVDKANAASGNGTSWATAYTSLQTALTAAQTSGNSSVVLVAEGTFKPTSATTYFTLYGVSEKTYEIRGGYCHADRSWNPERCPTVLSGDLNGDDGTVAWPASKAAALTAIASGVLKDNAGSLLSIDRGAFSIRGIAFKAAKSQVLVSIVSDMVFLDCLFEHNVISQIEQETTNSIYSRSIFRFNIVTGDALLYKNGNSYFTVAHSLFYWNIGTIAYANDNNMNDYIINGCSFIANSTEGSPLIMKVGARPIRVSNSLFHGNVLGGAKLVYARGGYQSGFGSLAFYNNAFPSSSMANLIDTAQVLPLVASANFLAAPVFIDSASGDFRQRASSNLIDAGNNAYNTETLDLARAARVYDGDENGTAMVDVGAYEFVPAPIGCAGSNDFAVVRRLLDTNALAMVPEALVATCEERDGSMRVVALHLNDLRLFRLPSRLSELTALERLELKDNLLTDFPAGLQSFPRLKVVDLEHNGLDSLSANFAPIAQSPLLDSLKLANNRLRYIHSSVLARTDLGATLEANNLCAMRSAVDAWASAATNSAWGDSQYPLCKPTSKRILVAKDNESCVVGLPVSFTSVSAAISSAGTVDGDEVVICDGEYNESLLITKALTVRRALASYGDVIVAGKQTNNVRIWGYYSVLVQAQGQQPVAFKGLKLENTNTSGAAIILKEDNFIHVEGCHLVSPNGYAIHTQYGKTNTGFGVEVRSSGIEVGYGFFPVNYGSFVRDVVFDASKKVVEDFGGKTSIWHDVWVHGTQNTAFSLQSTLRPSLYEHVVLTNVSEAFDNVVGAVLLDVVIVNVLTDYNVIHTIGGMGAANALGVKMPSYLENLLVQNVTLSSEDEKAFGPIVNTVIENLKIDNISGPSTTLVFSYFQNSVLNNVALSRISGFTHVWGKLFGGVSIANMSAQLPLGSVFAYTLEGHNEISNSIVKGLSAFANECGEGSLTIQNSLFDNTTCGTRDAAFSSSISVSSADPLFTNPAGGDLTLQSTSPAINTGNSATTVTDFVTGLDLAGSPRIIGGRIDKGAYEFFSSTNSTLTLTSDGHGSVVPVVAQSVKNGTAASISATASQGYKFLNWKVLAGNAVLANPALASTTVKIYGNTTVQAQFVALPALTVEFEASGSGHAASQILYGDLGQALAVLAASAASDYRFWKWQVVSGSANIADSLAASTTVTMRTAATVRALYLPLYDLTLAHDGAGVVNASRLSNLSLLDTVRLAAVATEGSVFVRWDLSPAGGAWLSSSTSNNANIVLYGDVTATAVFKPLVTQFDDGCGDAHNTGVCHNPLQNGPDFKKVWMTNNSAQDSLFVLAQACATGYWESDQYFYFDFDGGLGDAQGYDQRLKLDYLREGSADSAVLGLSREVWSASKWTFAEAYIRKVALGYSQTTPDSLLAEAGTLWEMAMPLPSFQKTFIWSLQGSHDTLGSANYEFVPIGKGIRPDGLVTDWQSGVVACGAANAVAYSESMAIQDGACIGYEKSSTAALQLGFWNGTATSFTADVYCGNGQRSALVTQGGFAGVDCAVVGTVYIGISSLSGTVVDFKVGNW